MNGSISIWRSMISTVMDSRKHFKGSETHIHSGSKTYKETKTYMGMRMTTEERTVRVRMGDSRTDNFLEWVDLWKEVCAIEGKVYDEDHAMHVFLRSFRHFP